MQDTAGGARSVLAYLRDMIGYCKDQRRQDLEWYYEEAVDFLSARIFGKLPPRKQDLLGTIYKPDNPSIPEGFRPTTKQCPLRKIVKINDHPHGLTTSQWEMLECGHELSRYPGYNNPVIRRRCIYCAAQKAFARKRPTSVSITEAKAVSA